MADRRIILASNSPRRQDLLRVLAPSFEIIPSEVVEDPYTGSNTPAEYVLGLACRKAQAVADRCGGDAIILGADTTVVLDNRVLNKPHHKEEAVEMLKALGGHTHEVITGLCVIDNRTRRDRRHTERTRVRMRPLHADEIQAYVATGEPMDKAGAYAIQGKAVLFIEGIEGCYFNVVGLPLYALGQILREMGVRCL